MGFKEDSTDEIPVDEHGKAIDSGIHYLDTYKYMEEQVTNGKTRSIGLSNFNIEQIKNVLAACKIRPVCNQFEIGPTLHNTELVEFCLKENIVPVAYAPLGAPDRDW
jgi:aldehyde reductase